MSEEPNPWLPQKLHEASKVTAALLPSTNPYVPGHGAPLHGHPQLGHVVPVLGAHGGAGASVCAAALADAAAHAGLRVLLVDAADPARSGLAFACDVEGTVLAQPGRDRRGIQLARRRGIDVRRVAPGHNGLAALDVGPDLESWTLDLDTSYDVTVVDVGCDAWRLLAGTSTTDPGWLAAPASVVVVLRATRRGLGQLEGVLAAVGARADEHKSDAVKALVRVGSPTWPAHLIASAGGSTQRLLKEAVDLPWDAEMEQSGVMTAPTPEPLQSGAARLLHAVGTPIATPPPLSNPRRFIRPRTTRSH